DSGGHPRPECSGAKREAADLRDDRGNRGESRVERPAPAANQTAGTELDVDRSLDRGIGYPTPIGRRAAHHPCATSTTVARVERPIVERRYSGPELRT